MPRLVYDTRFFVEYFYSDNKQTQEKARNLISASRDRHISAITIHELYRMSLAKEGRETAKMRREAIEDLFSVVDVDSNLAVRAAELRHKRVMPMGDSLIAATCIVLKGECVTDDPHFTQVKEIKVRWI